MDVGDYQPVPDTDDVYVHDVGLYGAQGYGAVYIVDADRPALIDTGTGINRESLVETLSELGIGAEELAYIIPTHAHLDHAGGAGYLVDQYPSAEVVTPEPAVRHLVDPTRLIAGTREAVGDQWRYYADPVAIPEGRIRGLADGEIVDLGDRTLTTHWAHGHAPHHAFFYDSGADLVYTADAAGIHIQSIDVIRQSSPPPQFDLRQARADARRIADLDPEILCFGHFGPRSFESGLMEEYSRTLVEWVAAVREKRAELEDDAAVITHFENAVELDNVWTPERQAAESRLNTRGALTYLDTVDEE